MLIQIDKSTLPLDGQRIKFQKQSDESWHEGTFDSNEGLFIQYNGDFAGIWHVYEWELI